MTNDDYYDLTKRFLLGETREIPTILTYTESIKQFLDNLKPRSSKESKHLSIVKEKIKKIHFMARSLEERVSILEEQARVLKEGQE